VLSSFGRGAHLQIVRELHKVFTAQHQYPREMTAFQRSCDLLSLPFLTIHDTSETNRTNRRAPN
jgi:hypothetical protein